MKYTFLIFFLISILNYSCQTAAESSSVQTPKVSDNTSEMKDKESDEKEIKDDLFSKNSTYDFSQPLLTMPLSLVLLEISGLGFYPKTNQLLAVNDERGWIFFLNSSTGKVESKVTFSGNGDFEGIELVGDKISVVKSNGDIYFYDLKNEKAGDRIKTELKTSNDIEGLAFDEKNNKLLLACKGNPNLGDSDQFKKTKNIYSFDLGKNELEPLPFISVEDKVLEEYVKELGEKNDYSKKKLKKMKNRAKDFSPSGIAIHPKTNDYYLLSSQGKLLVILNSKKELRQVVLLDEKMYRQPEGICFAPNGDLYISNEGKGLGAKIFKFNPSD